MKYDEIYKNNDFVWGDSPNKLLEMIADKADNSAPFLDLGCGQGRDSLFMLKKGFRIVAVDKSQEGLNKISETVSTAKLPEDMIELVCGDAKDFSIKANGFSVINAFNVFQFMDKADVLAVIENIKKGLIVDGYIVVSGFLSDPDKKTDKGFFKEGELKNLFSDFASVFYEEKVIDDLGHPGCPNPHQHHVVKMISQK